VLLALGGESGGLGGEVVPFRNARRSARRNPVVRNGGLMVAGHLQQVGADGIEAVVSSQSSIGIEGLEQLGPAGGPWTMAAAMA